MSDRYEESGVSLARGDFASADARKKMEQTFGTLVEVDSGIPVISLTRAIPQSWVNPQLMTAADGVGTKLIYASTANENRTVGQDLVAMVVDDLARYNVHPIAFSCYRGTNRLRESVFSEVLEGLVQSCVEAQVPLISGETAEMPDFYIPPHYELVGFAVGVYELGALKKGQETKEGDLLIGLPSNGFGSNGFSLIRQVWSPWDVINRDTGPEIEEILEPTPIYTVEVLEAFSRFPSIRGWAHITGGGLGERGKLASLLPKGLSCVLDYSSWYTPEIYQDLEREANLTKEQMANALNMGLIMIAPVDQEEAPAVVDFFKESGVGASVVGQVVRQEEAKKIHILWG